VEHVIVSDGPDDHLADLLPLLPSQRYDQLREHDPAIRWGHWARLKGIAISRAPLIGYCDDDDLLRPEHCQILARALADHPEAGFAYSKMIIHSPGAESPVGTDPPCYGQVGTPMIMHRREILSAATWEHSWPSIDWDIVERWIAAGIGHVFVPEITCDIWPSAYGS
jgi:hypothetical protein